MNADSSIRRSYKVAVVDDHPIVRQGLCQAVARETDLQVCAEASGIEEALRKIDGTCPDVLVIDLSLDGENGIDLIDYAKSRAPALKILVYSAHDEETFAGRVLRAGGLGFINKREPISKVVEAIRQVLRGEVYLSPQMTKSLLHRAALGKTLDSEPLTTLSDRESAGLSIDRRRAEHRPDRRQAPVESQNGRIAPQNDQAEAQHPDQRPIEPPSISMGDGEAVRPRVTTFPRSAGPWKEKGPASTAACRRSRPSRSPLQSTLPDAPCRKPVPKDRRSPGPGA